ncbi:hypothetical protein M6I34_06125 [Burkholderiaceae bacterium FT117]|uniref:hypothetical protein n=1 Tax=Zeimonas sediminis TaxID=2944268 RepID=UPI002342F298|nr:hypothetical protein [Zeimonas sediminis]MCM5570078.1 hypothetical protein [Zeimonas sediminis]
MSSRSRLSRSLALASVLAVLGPVAHAAATDDMLAQCRARASKELGVDPSSVQVKYEGQRTDKSHAVNGSAVVSGQTRTFQCSFEKTGHRISRFVTNPAESGSAPQSGDADPRMSASARRAGEGSFDARGPIPCAHARGQPMTQCDFAAARGGGGSATVVVTHPGGRKRTIFFSRGSAVSADTSQADGYGAFRARKEGDLHFIRVGDERYEIPDAVIFGG